MDNEITLVGGDRRSFWAAEYLRQRGMQLHCCGVPGEEEQPLPKRIRTLILPFPSFRGELIRGASAIPLREVLPCLGEGSRVFGGLLQPWEAAFGERGACCCELYGSEPLTTANAALTAEGAVALAMEHLPISLEGANCLVIGFGRIGKLLARKLSALGAKLCICARSSADRAMAAAWGLDSEETGVYGRGLSHYAAIFNTVPQEILSASQLAQISRDCLLIELASAPGGFSQETCKALGLQSLSAPGLPGRYAPKTAGILYAKSILSFCEGEDAP
ncbi:MAG: hypothetical protein IJ453_05575 [Oscillospiraceae bacterium]|nr:hypothetical protein [Oscillospiraceae bacterium]